MGQHLPRPVIVIVALHLAAAIAFGAMAHLDPSNQFPELVQNDDGLFAVGLYANRNIGVGVALLVGLLLRSPLAIGGVMLARFVTDLADLVTAVTQGGDAGALAGQAVFFGVLFASEIYVLRAIFRSDDPSRQEVRP